MKYRIEIKLVDLVNVFLLTLKIKKTIEHRNTICDLPLNVLFPVFIVDVTAVRRSLLQTTNQGLRQYCFTFSYLYKLNSLSPSRNWLAHVFFPG